MVRRQSGFRCRAAGLARAVVFSMTGGAVLATGSAVETSSVRLGPEPEPQRPATVQAPGPATDTLSVAPRAVLDRYYINCHNDRLWTGGLSLDAASVDAADPNRHADVWERVIDSGSADPAVRRARRQQQQSILDSVTDKLTDPKVAVGPRDRAKLDEYTEAVRDDERRIQLAEQQRDIEPSFTEQPSAPPRVFEEHLGLNVRPAVPRAAGRPSHLARVVTFMMGREQSTRSYPQIRVPNAHHPLSHQEDDPERIAVMSKINAYHAKLTADYLAPLRAPEDADGSLIDNMTILYGATISNSTRHLGVNLPLVLLGGGAGRLQGGRNLRYPGDTSNADLRMTLMDKLDMPLDQLGYSTTRSPIHTLSQV